MAITIQTTTFQVIYIYSRDAHSGLLKIGKTSVAAYDVNELTDNCEKLQEATKERIKEAVTFGITDLHILHSEVGYFVDSQGRGLAFDDHAVHDVLLNSGFLKANLSTIAGTPDEWFKVSLEDAIKAIKAVKNEQAVIDGPKIKPSKFVDIVFREEQNIAIQSTIDHFNEVKYNADRKMLWNAKMRFGKTLCALELINRLDINKVLILTHRPDVRSGWFDDYHLIKFKDNWQYGSKNGSPYAQLNDKDDHKEWYFSGKDLSTMQNDLKCDGTRYIYFASMQDLRGKEKDSNGQWKDNNKLVFETDWDLIIFDEAHEGTQTSLGQSVIKELTQGNKNPLKLFLSGTPFNILSQFDESEIYTWDYVMEQQAKEEWDKKHPGEQNPYEGLAKLNIYTYNIGEVFNKNPEYSKSEDDYFNFAEFFRTFKGNKEEDGIDMPFGVSVGDFVHENDVISFLDLLRTSSSESQYPYSNDEFRSALSHTLWMIPGVAAGARLTSLINKHPLHTIDGFEVVNVAGEGNDLDKIDPDDSKKKVNIERKALDKVNAALKVNKRTITLSCGRLTTGVSIPEWTGVFMMNGGYSTGAANYMQTIFRGQTPYKNGAIKKNCYAFDFAPDRTLTVVDDYIKVQPRSRNGRGTGNGEKKKNVDDFLRFCPIISMKGSEEITYDANTFIQKVNQAYSDHIISHGFKSRHLFKNITLFSPEDHELLSKVEKLMGGAKVKVNSDGKIDIATNGVTGEGGGNKGGKGGSRGSKGNKSDGTPKQAKSDEQEQRRKSQRVLDAIFVRFPLLLFGAVDEAQTDTLMQLINDIDDESWSEFMPMGFTKGIFGQISHLIDIDNLVLSASLIINQARNADNLPIADRIIEISRMISKFHFTDKETVLTPWRVVNIHLSSTLGGYDFYDESHNQLLDKPELRKQGDITDRIFGNENSHILEINSKSGAYPLWVAHTYWAYQHKDGMTKDEDWSLWKKVVENNIYVVCKTRMAEKITKRVLRGYNNNINVNTRSYVDLIERLKDETKKAKLINELKKPSTYGKDENKMIEFDAVVGNPPYQITLQTKNRQEPIYQHFYELADKISDIYSLISPARFLFNAGLTPKDWNRKMLNDVCLEVKYFTQESSECFPNIDIKGGVAVILKNRNNQNGPIGQFTTHKELKLLSTRFDTKAKESPTYNNSLSSIVFGGRSDLKFNDKFLSDHPESIKDRLAFIQIKDPNVKELCPNEEYELKSSTFETLPYVFKNTVSDPEKYYCILGLNRLKRTRLYIERKYMTPRYIKSNNIEKYKIFVPESNGSGSLGETLGQIEIGVPGDSSTTTFISIGSFDTKEEAVNCTKYIKTKFVRCLLGILKKTQHNSRDTWSYVPLQNFTSHTDIDWSKSISEIDQQLYAKYGLSIEEVNFIESMVKPME